VTSPRTALVLAVIAGAVGLAGCSSSSSGGQPSAAGQTSAPVVPSRASGSSPPASLPPTGPPLSQTQNLLATADVKAQLVQAGAATFTLPASDYVGLRPGDTYFAFDAATSTYWAGAALVPRSSSLQAQVTTQDDGSYLVFTMPSGGGWLAYPVGASGEAGGTCRISVPPPILKVWGWAPHTCLPRH
jgi:hypothetical protein